MEIRIVIGLEKQNCTAFARHYAKLYTTQWYAVQEKWRKWVVSADISFRQAAQLSFIFISAYCCLGVFK
jgi:hypothetical protein